jgi:DNA-binding MarR family transcriptional regulator/GNAT superfamily N-acetyltransferase
MVDKVNYWPDFSGMRPIDERAERVRQFNRFYTRRIGVLGEGHLGSPFSLTETRVLYELAHRDLPTASEIGEALGLDRGYLSRTLRAFKRRGLITTKPGKDRRQSLLTLTAAGRKAFAPLEKGARRSVVDLLASRSDGEQRRIMDAMDLIRSALGDVDSAASSDRPFTIRTHRLGDMGWITHRHGVLYAKEYGWDERFEALVARVVADFIERFDPERERCWVAERNGEIVGSIFAVKKSKTVVKLRLLYVEPSARGLGIGERLVDEMIQFSRNVGYKRIVLWTQSDLVSARRIYKAKGFELTGAEGHDLFGSPLTAETWELQL